MMVHYKTKMKILRNLLPAICLSILLSGCDTTVKPSDLDLDGSDNMVLHELSLDFMLGRPHHIGLLNDDFIAFTDVVDDRLVGLYDLKNNKLVSRTIRIGGGPNELLNPIKLSINHKNKTLNVFQRQHPGIFNEYQLTDLIADNPIPISSTQLKDSDQALKTENGYIGAGPYEFGSIRLFDSIGNVIVEHDIYPDFIKNVDSQYERYRLGQGIIECIPKTNTMVHAGIFTGVIDFFRIENDKLELIKHYDLRDSKIENRISKNTNKTNMGSSDISYFQSSYTTPENAYILLNKRAMDGSKDSNNTYILQFSSDGDFIKSYQTDRVILSFCVSDDGSKAYGFVFTEDKTEVMLAEIVL